MAQPSLFDALEAPEIGDEIPFAVALLGFGSLHGLGQKGLQSLVNRFGDGIGQAFIQNKAELSSTLKDCGISGADKFATLIDSDRPNILRTATDQLKRLGDRNVHVLPPSRLPQSLRSIEADAPKWLFVEGQVDALDTRPVIAVVGTRQPTERGRYATRIISRILSAYPVVMVSGLADGIDCEAHYHSLQYGVRNVAFLGHGINLVFPEGTAEIRQSIIARGGAVVSEYMPDQHYQRRLFVERNRLQAALADMVIPVEAAATSGTAHTIRFARRYSKPLVGMRWEGANGILDNLRENNDCLIDILTPGGQQQLDALIKTVLCARGVDAYPFRNLEQQALREFGSRSYTEADLQRLVQVISTAGLPRKPLEPPTDGTS